MTVFRRDLSPFHVAIIGLSLLCLLVGLQVYLFAKQARATVESQNWVRHTYDVLDTMRSLSSRVKDAELGIRGYILTGEKRFLDPYQAALGFEVTDPQTMRNPDPRTISILLKDLRNLLDDNPEELENFNNLEALVTELMDYFQRSIQSYQTDGSLFYAMNVNTNKEKALMDSFRTQIFEMASRERNLLHNRLQQQDSARHQFTSFLALAAFITYFSLLTAITLIVLNFVRIRSTEQQLYEKETMFRSAVEGGVDAFLLFRAEHEKNDNETELLLEYINPVGEQMLGKRMAELEDQPINTVLNRNAGDIKETYTQVLLTRRIHESEYCVSSGELAGRYYQEQAIPLPNMIAISFRDITERKQVEQMKNEFVSTVSHELRTPLTSIRGSIGLVTGGIAGEISQQAKDLLTIAYNNCERLVRLINDILDIEKIESGKMVFDCRPVHLLPLLRQNIEANAAFAAKFDVTLELEHHSNITDETAVIADSDRLSQIMTNLLSNASKFSPQGGMVTMRCKPDQSFIRIEVEDRGKGIPRAFHEQIFQKFSQADSSDTRQIAGTGLGLSIVKSMVEEMKGTIGFTSIEGKGTLFHFTLPLAKNGEHKTPAPSAHNNDKPRILICEDEEDIANLLRLILERGGFASDVAENARQAMDLLKQHHYEAMTLDLLLPDKCGITLLKELRADDTLNSLPVIVVSARAEEGKKILNGDAVGIMDWMVKPIDVERLLQTVRDLKSLHAHPHILHVEDDADIAEMLRIPLEKMAEITNARTVKQARELLYNKHFDLVILDIGLPDGKGTELLPILGSHGNQAIPVVLFTASEIPRQLSEQVSAALTKSLNSEQALLDTIQQLIQKTRPA